MENNVTDIEFAAFLVARGYPCTEIVPLDDRKCGFLFPEAPEALYREFLNAYPIPTELEGIRAYRHLVADAQRALVARRGGRRNV